MAKRNHHTSITPNTCPQCGEPKGDFIVANQACFKSGKKHTDGKLCPDCQQKFDVMVDKLIAGGTLCVCTQCTAVSVIDVVPETLQKFVTQMPNGGNRLEIAGCPLCTKESTDDPPTEIQNPILGEQPGEQA
jgi:hypothetical protein